MILAILAAALTPTTPMPITLDKGYVICVQKAERYRGPAQRVVIVISQVGKPPSTNVIQLPKGRLNKVQNISFPAAGPLAIGSSFTVKGQYLVRNRWQSASVREISRNDQHFEFWYDSVRDTGNPNFGSLKVDLVRSYGSCPTG